MRLRGRAPGETSAKGGTMSRKAWPLRSDPRKYSPRQAEDRNASVIARGKNLMQLPGFARSTTLRWTVLVAAIFAAIIVAMLSFVYLKTRHDLTLRSDRLIASQMGVFAKLSSERRLDAIDEYLETDPARVRLAALFDSDGRKMAGNLEGLPAGFEADTGIQSAVVDRVDESS